MTERKQRESKIRNELVRLATEHGGELRPKAVVEAARPDTSPLHNSFEWDDSEAAEKYRLHQARQLITTVYVVEQVGKRMEAVQVFVSLTTDRKDDGVGYRLSQSVMSDEELRRQMLTDAMADMQRFREKYRRLNELAKVFEAIEHVEQKELAATA